jgi:predicted kinase
MYVMINGAFGIGKSAVARELRTLLPGSVIFDPEWPGFALRRLSLRRVSEYQHLSSWRRLTVMGARCVAAMRTPVIVPMAFSDLAYLNEVRSGLGRSGQPVLHFCLSAPIEVVRERLTARGEPPRDPRWSWVHRRAAECCIAHQASAFAVHVPTDGRPPAVIAADLAAQVQRRDR